MDVSVRCNQGEPLNQRGGSDNAIRQVFGISLWKSHGARAGGAAHWQNYKPSVDFVQKGFEADAELDPALTRERCQLQEGDVGNCQTVPTATRIFDGRLGFA